MYQEHKIDVGCGHHVVVQVFGDTSVRVRLTDENGQTVDRDAYNFLSFATHRLDGRDHDWSV